MSRMRLLAVLSLNIVLLGACAAAPVSPTATAPPSPLPPTATTAPTQPPPPPTVAPTLPPTLVPTQPPTPTSAPTRTPIPTSSPKDVAALIGVYVMSFSKEKMASLFTDMELAASNIAVCENAGEYTLTLAADRWQLRQAALSGCAVQTPSYSGDWRLVGDQIVMHWDSVRGCSLDSTYAWKLDSTSLRFTLVDDDCLPRIVIFRSLPWTRQAAK